MKPEPLERKVLARPEEYLPSTNKLRVIGVFNPGVTTYKDKTLLMVRVAEEYKKNGEEIHLPFFEIPNKENVPPKIGFDTYSKKEITEEKYFVKIPASKTSEETVRLKHISLPRIMLLDKDEKVIKKEQNPALNPSWEYERFGIEDIGITFLKKDKKYILTYVSPHRDFGVSTSFLETTDFKNYKRLTKEPIFPGMKDIILYPEKIPNPESTMIIKKGEELYAALIRPNAFAEISTPGLWISYSPDLVHWGQAHRLTTKKMTGRGTPPIKIKDFWFSTYHEVTKNNNKVKYETKLMRADAKEPWKNLHTSDVLLTREDYRKILPEDGYIPDVVFTSGITEKNGIITLFSGIDDTWIVKDKFHTKDLIKFLG